MATQHFDASADPPESPGRAADGAKSNRTGEGVPAIAADQLEGLLPTTRRPVNARWLERVGEYLTAPPPATATDAPRAAVATDPADTTLPRDDVGSGLAASHMHMRYQPIVSFADRRPVMVEVLARLDHPTLGVLFPAAFVPQIEHAGLARQMTETVVDIAFTDFAAHLRGLDLDMSLNLPLETMIDPDFGDWLQAQLLVHHIDARRLILELTESQPVAGLGRIDRRRLIRAMKALSTAGFRLAIDDFGPEMPRREDLFDLPFDILKLDKSMVRTPREPGLAERTLAAARRHGMETIAEGVEDETAWSAMRALGVTYAQGYLMSRPLPCRHIGEWIAAWTADTSELAA